MQIDRLIDVDIQIDRNTYGQTDKQTDKREKRREGYPTSISLFTTIPSASDRGNKNLRCASSEM